MANKNNIIKEINELVQHIKNEYQEGIDYKFVAESYLKKNGMTHIHIISPRLKKYCREKFGFPLGVDDYLDYEKNDKEGNDLLYRTSAYYDYDYLSFSDNRVLPAKEKKESCQVCGSLASEKNGRMKLWDGEKISNEPSPNVIAYFHPHCAKKYFANKDQPNKSNNSPIKEKLLRNLDKICLGPIGWLANAEIVKREDIGKENPGWFEKLESKIHKVEIENEEINLTYLEGKIKKEIRKAIINEIKQNPQDWKIEASNIYDIPSQNIPDSFKILKHKSGRRHWNIGIYLL